MQKPFDLNEPQSDVLGEADNRQSVKNERIVTPLLAAPRYLR